LEEKEGGMSTKLRALTLALTVGLCLVASASSTADVPQINDEAAVLAPTLPTADPCVFNDFRVDVLGNFTGSFLPGSTTLLFFNLLTYDACTGQSLFAIGPLLAPIPIDPSDLIVSPTHDSVDLDVTLPPEDFVFLNITPAPVTLDLHWASVNAVSDDSANVTGTLSASAFDFVLDNSIVWHPWGSASFPWAGVWQCRFAPTRESRHAPGCLGQ
jgi:hypothetical protein